MDPEYDNLPQEERERRDKEDREREKQEQAALPYRWTQELGEVDVTIPVPQGTRGKDLVVVMQKKRLSVAIKGQEPILAGELCKEIKVEDSTWSVQDNKVVIVHLEKLNNQTWWENVLTHHPKINTRRIEPENSKLSDLDGETRSMVEKMMFDNQQKALKKFQEAHPELDFSNAKIS
ncbi:hypothetical protein CVT24_000524 [Panaeolus cyanescens]|uniref:Nuclear movement protein nudC n=1 Tax=Panaeolus cyanescens TaxID=181874 RepID=A0A409VDD5_9AGAR|nr:hypothetical protein CVT24_000524 [Panaeolus cyanescens]